MGELAVSYCPKHGHYAYCRTSRHPQYPKCGRAGAMNMARMHYAEFMRIFCDERDKYLPKEILRTSPSLVERLTEPCKRHNNREIAAETNNVIMNPNTEDKILSDIVKWMHDIIWSLIHERRHLLRNEVAATDIFPEQEEAEGQEHVCIQGIVQDRA